MTAMRIVYFSDVHIETRESQTAAPWSDTLPLGFGPELSTFVGAADLLILAGDIGRVHSTRNVSPLSYAREAADLAHANSASSAFASFRSAVSKPSVNQP
jgi:hypothetical protein